MVVSWLVVPDTFSSAWHICYLPIPKSSLHNDIGVGFLEVYPVMRHCRIGLFNVRWFNSMSALCCVIMRMYFNGKHTWEWILPIPHLKKKKTPNTNVFVKSYMKDEWKLNSGPNIRFVTYFQGQSVKYSPQRVGLQHQMRHDDVIQIVKK